MCSYIIFFHKNNSFLIWEIWSHILMKWFVFISFYIIIVTWSHVHKTVHTKTGVNSENVTRKALLSYIDHVFLICSLQVLTRQEIIIWNHLQHSIFLSFIKCMLKLCYSIPKWQRIYSYNSFATSSFYPTWACLTAWFSSNGNFMLPLHFLFFFFRFMAQFVRNGLQAVYRVLSPPVLGARLVQLVPHHPEEPEWK